MSDASQIINQHEQMAADRSQFETHWQEITERVLPRQDQWFGTVRTQGDKRTSKIFDSTAPLALTRFAAAMESIATPRAERWHKLTPQWPLEEDKDSRTWLEEITKQLFRVRYSPRSNFASQAHEFYMSLGALGTACMYVDDDPGRGIRYSTRHMSEIFLAEDHQGRIDKVHRKFGLTARQAIQQFGEAELPEKIRKAAETQPETKFDFLHCVYPAPEVKAWRVDAQGMPWTSRYICMDSKSDVMVSGYWEFPYMIGRYVVAPGETYGRSPAMDALADIKMLNEMEKTGLRALHHQVDPTLLLADNGVLQPFQMRPGAMVKGGVDANGRQSVIPLQTGGNIPALEEKTDQKRRLINDHFLVTLFQVLAEDRTNMTATEVLQRAAEKGALLAPAAGRLQSEFLGPLIEREIGIMARAGALPPAPPSWEQMGGEYQVEYVSEITRAMRASEGVGILRMMEGISPVAQIDPSILDRVDGDEALKVLADVNGVPSKVLRSDDEVAAIKQGRAQQEQAAQLLSAAQVAGSAAKDLAQAQATAGIPNAGLLGL